MVAKYRAAAIASRDSRRANPDTASPPSYRRAADVSERPFLFAREPVARHRAGVVGKACPSGLQAVRTVRRAQLRLRAAGGRGAWLGAARGRLRPHPAPEPGAS